MKQMSFSASLSSDDLHFDLSRYTSTSHAALQPLTLHFNLSRCTSTSHAAPLQVVSTEAMDELADWPTRNEDFRFDPLDPSDITWHR